MSQLRAPKNGLVASRGGKIDKKPCPYTFVDDFGKQLLGLIPQADGVAKLSCVSANSRLQKLPLQALE